MLIFQGPVAVKGPRGDVSTRLSAWLNEDGTAELVLEHPDESDKDVTIEIGPTSVALELRIALGLAKPVAQRDKPPASVYRNPRARRAKRSWES